MDLALTGAFTLYHQPLAATTAAVLVYLQSRCGSPVLLGSVAFIQLRRTLQRETQPAGMCTPLAEPIETVPLPAATATAE